MLSPTSLLEPSSDADRQGPDVEEAARDRASVRRRLFEEGSPFLPVGRDEIVGIDGILDGVERIAGMLGNYEEYARHGVRLEPGILLHGSPGTGKTTVARYLATCAGSLFVNIRDWPHSGDIIGEADVIEIFQHARDAHARTGQPVILFWDEFENNAKARDKATPAQAAAVSQLTAELDGIQGKTEGVLLIGCTNYANLIDPALVRPGRLGVSLRFSSPDRAGRAVLLGHYIDRLPNSVDDAAELAELLDHSTKASGVEEAVMAAWHRAVESAVSEGREPILDRETLFTELLERLLGPDDGFQKLPEPSKRAVAVHELGHALAALAVGESVRLVTIRPDGKSLGRVIRVPADEHVHTLDAMRGAIVIALASRAAETLMGLPFTTGASADIASANQSAADLVTHHGAGLRTGLFSSPIVSKTRTDGGSPRAESETRTASSDEDVTELLVAEAARARRVLERVGVERLDALTDVLVERVSMTGPEFAELVEGVCGPDALESIALA